MKHPLVTILLFLLASFQLHAVPPGAITEPEEDEFSPWLGTEGFQTLFDRMVTNKMYVVKIEGRHNKEESANEYRAVFAAKPASIQKWYSYFGMTATKYEKRSTELLGEGYEEAWQQTFEDGAGATRLQVVWVKRR